MPIEELYDIFLYIRPSIGTGSRFRKLFVYMCLRKGREKSVKYYNESLLLYTEEKKEMGSMGMTYEEGMGIMPIVF